MAQGSRTNRVYLENPMNIQMGPTEENPDGQVFVLRQGWNELPDEVKNHPVIQRLKPESEAEAARRERIQEAEKKRNEAVQQAEVEFNKSMAEAEEMRAEDIAKRNEERLQRMQEKMESGLVAYEPHPDPDAARAEALTLEPATQMVSAAGMAYKGSETVSAAQQRTMQGTSTTTAQQPGTQDAAQPASGTTGSATAPRSRTGATGA